MNELFLLADGPGFTGFFTDFNTTFWSALLRIFEAMIAAAPYLVAGVLAAGVLRGMAGAERLRSWLGVGHWSGPFRAWGLGILLPICSLGALPVARELRRAGVPSGTVLSFVIVAPVLNPVSIIYGLSHIEPSMLLYFAVGTFAVSVGIGLVWNWFVSAKHDVVPEEMERAPRDTNQRLKVVGYTAAKGLVGPAMVDYGLALLAVGLLGAFLPHAALQTGLTRDNAFAPVLMGLVAIPVYVTPTEVMMHFGHIVRDGFSLGAAFALIVLGAGANVGVANWLRRDYGFRALLLFVGLLIGSTLVIGVTADRTIKNGTAGQTDHTHAFDPFTRLARVNEGEANIGWVVGRVWRESTPTEVYGLCLLAAVVCAGVTLQALGAKANVEHLLEASVSSDTEEVTFSKWNPALSSTQLLGVGIVGIVVASVLGLYLFYPSKANVFDDLSNIRLGVRDAIMAEDEIELDRRVRQMRTQLQKLPTSAVIRFQSVTEEQDASLDELLYTLRTLENYGKAGQFTEARFLLNHFEKTYLGCSTAFRKTN